MKFNYAICYPDKEQIVRYPDLVEKEDIIEIFESMDWDNELKKEVHFYSYSLDILRVKDKVNLIFSAIGKDSLESFQVMLIKNSSDYCANFSIQSAKILLEKFLNGSTEEMIEEIDLKSKEQSSIKNLSFAEIWIARLGSFFIIMILTMLGLSLILDKTYDGLLAGVIGLILIFIIGSILFERDIRRNN